MRRFLLPALAVASLAVAACGGSDAPAGPGPITNPPPAAVAAVDVAAPAGTALTVGRTAALTATPRDAQGNALANRAVSWSADPASVATVDANGVVTAVAPGSVTITAASEGRTARLTLTVAAPAPAPVASVVIAGASATLRAGDTLRLAATARDSAGAALPGRAIRWTSSAPIVATVDSVSGLVTAIRAGQATLTATSEGKSAAHALTVAAAPAPVRTVTITSALDTLEAYQVVQLRATLRDSADAVLADRAVRWTSSNPAVATVDSVTGELTGVDRGTVTVTATSEGKSGTATRVVVIRYRSLTTGSEHACDIASGGIAWCWGINGTEGRLGSGQAGAFGSFSSQPVRVAGNLRFNQLSTYGNTTCGIATNGTLHCWGSNAAFALGAGSSAAQSATPVPVAAPFGLAFKQLSVGNQHACAVTIEGRLYCWGPNSSGQLGTGNTTWAQTPVAAAGALTFASVSAGTDYTCGVTAAGAAWCWGANGLGQLGDGAPPSMGNTQSNSPVQVTSGLSFVSISASNQVTCAVANTPAAYCWGRGIDGRLGTGNTGVTSTPSPVVVGAQLRSVAVGFSAACGVDLSSSGVWCWGMGANGQLGQVVTNSALTPVRAGGTLRAADVSTANVSGGSGNYTCAISADRLTTYCWGRNDKGQLGNGTTTEQTAVNATPSIVVGQRPLAATR
ncbi:Ig-like domain-containing protein [Roseisolibacter sp. H3M3-2]|uniref:RCC1 domain-containing protein n=1 Tax=Roseisolibacter sp. H3M3-2 TaxID=3031323 RepID=UPI0023DA35CD|nr:Ig-like domain-containing protein [Roseisolibacter sp. H3M3-2]MDF1504264.1 Ig-like domain-containing protein [Roseisolibacter sp. H3M3-2]